MESEIFGVDGEYIQDYIDVVTIEEDDYGRGRANTTKTFNYTPTVNTFSSMTTVNTLKPAPAVKTINLSESTAQMSTTLIRYGKRWKKEDDANLIYLFEKLGKKWDFISMQFPGRTKEQVINRWVHLNSETIRKSEWSPEEDEKLEQLVNEYGKKWKCISKYLPGRTFEKCRRRWYQYEQTRGKKLKSQKITKIPVSHSSTTDNCLECPRTPSPFKEALAAFDINSAAVTNAPLSPEYIDDLAEIIDEELNFNDAENIFDDVDSTEST